jgi:hypothetical protein
MRFDFFLNASFRHLFNALFSKVDGKLFGLERSGDWKVVAQEVSDFQYGQRTQFNLIFCRQYASQRLALQRLLSQRSIGFG